MYNYSRVVASLFFGCAKMLTQDLSWEFSHSLYLGVFPYMQSPLSFLRIGNRIWKKKKKEKEKIKSCTSLLYGCQIWQNNINKKKLLTPQLLSLVISACRELTTYLEYTLDRTLYSHRLTQNITLFPAQMINCIIADPKINCLLISLQSLPSAPMSGCMV